MFKRLFLQGLLDEWTAKAPAVQDINSRGSALCSIISVLTSPAKAKIHHNSGIAKEYFKILQKHLSHVSVQHDHSSGVNSYVYLCIIYFSLGSAVINGSGPGSQAYLTNQGESSY